MEWDDRRARRRNRSASSQDIRAARLHAMRNRPPLPRNSPANELAHRPAPCVSPPAAHRRCACACPCDTVVVVDDAQKHERMHAHGIEHGAGTRRGDLRGPHDARTTPAGLSAGPSRPSPPPARPAPARARGESGATRDRSALWRPARRAPPARAQQNSGVPKIRPAAGTPGPLPPRCRGIYTCRARADFLRVVRSKWTGKWTQKKTR